MTIDQTNLQPPTNDDIRQLGLLATFHYVVGGILALFGCCPMLHLMFGLALVTGILPTDRPARFESSAQEFQQPLNQPGQSIQQGQPSQPGQSMDASGKPGQVRPNGSWPQQPSSMPARRNNADRNAEIAGGVIVIIFALVMIFTAWAVALLVILAGRKLKRRQSHTFCVVMAAIECIFMPFGTVLGVFTLVVITRPSVKALFETSAKPNANNLPSTDTGSSDIKQWP